MKKLFKNNDIIHTDHLNEDLKKIISKYNKEKKVIITDNNCKKYCLPLIEEIIDESFEVFEIKSGEEHKSMDTVQEIWDFLILKNFNRHSLMINLGGGMVTDIGGFAASTFKRGMPFINIPTSLLAQTDASLGGKTGINYRGLKNEIGVFNQAEYVIISYLFLKTLNKPEFLSGFAEMLKHGLIYEEKHLNKLFDFYINNYLKNNLSPIKNLINESVNIKKHFIKNDIHDTGIRRTLNFGHTFGHAFESFFNLKNKYKLRHGEAVAQGIICELFISVEKLNFDKTKSLKIISLINEMYSLLYISPEDFEAIYLYMIHDKKNTNDVINCILLEEIGIAKNDMQLSRNDINNALKYLNSLSNII